MKFYFFPDRIELIKDVTLETAQKIIKNATPEIRSLFILSIVPSVLEEKKRKYSIFGKYKMHALKYSRNEKDFIVDVTD